eukprot:CAMPEP_0205826402 /NCGR_PEP_ID=MMETSP0206-20130828/28520_1 /ASSEMBLY_ACC=CAM_ASM_000279 /TAXON_ID=36767 /ORGANISM="Euplotes focardii, Strain TN1" /LENGTH=111 /DNA_ID=CAMNT_0053126295 /DNA_START=223 /DNA_END=558 /DNA_ORIENTATION=-
MRVHPDGVHDTHHHPQVQLKHAPGDGALSRARDPTPGTDVAITAGQGGQDGQETAERPDGNVIPEPKFVDLAKREGGVAAKNGHVEGERDRHSPQQRAQTKEGQEPGLSLA